MDLLKTFWGMCLEWCCLRSKSTLELEEAAKWKDVGEEFTEILQKEWENRGFDHKEAKEWIESGFKPSDYDLIFYLKRKGCQPSDPDLEESVKEVSWKDIRPDFKCVHRRKWEDSGMDYEETKKWVELGFKPYDLYLIKEWKKRGFSYEEVKYFLAAGLDNYYFWDHWEKLKFTPYQVQEWLFVGLKQDEWNLANYLRKKNFEWEEIKKNLTNFRKEYSEVDQKEEKKHVFSEISPEVISELKKFNHEDLTSEQELLVNELIIDEELRQRYYRYGLCSECCQPNTGKEVDGWCQSCNSKRFQDEFKNWNSGNEDINEFIQKQQLETKSEYKIVEWIPYEKFNSVKHIADGGFGKVYKAKWDEGPIIGWDKDSKKWQRWDGEEVVLKSLNDSQNLTEEFLKEVSNYKLVDGDSFYGSIVPCYGISQDPVTKDYLMVMQYIPEGDLRKYLSDNQVSFKDRLRQLYWVADGLSVIHRMGLVHRDFHSGNILNRKFNDDVVCFITDLGLCRSANEKDKDKVYGVLPYLAPEVLNRKPYTQASDVYSFGMIAYEILTGLPPYYDMPHNEPLALYICEGLRPNIDELKIPQLLKNLIKKCWDADPLKRPKARELKKTLDDCIDEISKERNTEFYEQWKKMESFENSGTLPSIKTVQTHPQAIYTSRLLNYQNLPEPRNSKKVNDQFWGSRDVDLNLDNFVIDDDQVEQISYMEVPPKK